MAGQFSVPQLPKDKDLAGKWLDSTSSINKMKAEGGLLGQLWGVSNNIPHNIAAFLIAALLITGIIYTFIKSGASTEDKTLSVKDFWAIITPLITLAIGYLFGEKKREADKPQE